AHWRLLENFRHYSDRRPKYLVSPRRGGAGESAPRKTNRMRRRLFAPVVLALLGPKAQSTIAGVVVPCEHDAAREKRGTTPFSRASSLLLQRHQVLRER